MKTISETGTELSAGNKRLEEAAEDAAKHEVRQHKTHKRIIHVQKCHSNNDSFSCVGQPGEHCE